MSENLTMIFTLTSEEMECLGLNLTEEERIATVKSDTGIESRIMYPCKWNEKVFQTIKS